MSPDSPSTDKPARPIRRIVSMIAITWTVMIVFAGGGQRDLLAFAIATIVTGLPAVVLVLFLQFIEGLIGKSGRYIVSILGVLPLILVLYNHGRGEHVYMIQIVLSGLAWSAAWLGTSVLFLRHDRMT